MSRAQRSVAAVAAIALLLTGALGAFVFSGGDDASPQTAHAQEFFDPRGISVSGEGEVSATPDLARIHLGVEVRGSTLDDLRDDADVRMNEVIDALQSLGIDEGDIRTVTYDIRILDEDVEPLESEADTPVDDEATEDDEATDDEEAETEPPTGGEMYEILQLVEVRVTDIDLAGEVIDTALDSGANHVAHISFELEDREEAVAQARERAVQEVERKADHLAELTGVTLGAPIKIDERSPSGPPVPMDQAAVEADMAEDAGAPIEPGEQIIMVTVDVTYDIE